MTFKAQFSLANPEAVEATLTITMKIEDWKALRKQLPAAYPSWKLGGAITELVMLAEQEFEKKHEAQV